jgi:hypothetical protein
MHGYGVLSAIGSFLWVAASLSGLLDSQRSVWKAEESGGQVVEQTRSQDQTTNFSLS